MKASTANIVRPSESMKSRVSALSDIDDLEFVRRVTKESWE